MPDFSGQPVITPHVVLLSGNPQYPQQALSSGTMTPGDLINVSTTGALVKHATAEGNAIPAFADVNVTPDRETTTQAIDVPYASGETVKWIICRPGDMVYAWLPAAAAAIVAGDFLASNGDGSLRKLGTATNSEAVIGQAAESVNNSTGASRVRIRVRAM